MKLNSNTEFEKITGTAIAPMQCYAQPSIQLFNCDNLKLMANMEDESVDVILTDPPYLYLKDQKLEREFDEQLFFSECKRVLTKNGFIVLFGRGTSFYRWNTILDEIGFTFKEEVVWDKGHTSSPHNPVNRVHETISIHTKGKGTIGKILIPYLESKNDINAIHSDIKRLKSALNNINELHDIEHYVLTGEVRYQKLNKPLGNGTTNQTLLKQRSRGLATLKSIREGMRLKSIISETRDHYTSIHPTQKPVSLLERLLSLVIPQDKENKDITVLDPFGGSFSTMEAVYNMGMKGISCEIDEEYFEAGKKRIESLPPRQAVLFD